MCETVLWIYWGANEQMRNSCVGSWLMTSAVRWICSGQVWYIGVWKMRENAREKRRQADGDDTGFIMKSWWWEVKVYLLVMRSAAQPLKTAVKCLQWLRKSFGSLEKIGEFLTKGLCYKAGVDFSRHTGADESTDVLRELDAATFISMKIWVCNPTSYCYPWLQICSSSPIPMYYLICWTFAEEKQKCVKILLGMLVLY